MSPHRKYFEPRRAVLAFAYACAPYIACAQEPNTPVEAIAVLPRDLSPWGMFMSADVVVKVVMIGLIIASIVTWTVWLAKTIELMKARRQAKAALGALNAIQTLRNVKPSGLKEPAASFCAEAIAEFRLSEGVADTDGLKERIGSRLERLEAALSRRIRTRTKEIPHYEQRNRYV